MRILLTGKNGQLGFELRRALAVLGPVKALGRDNCDLANEIAVRRAVREFLPDVIINAAAYTAVDKAEDEFTLAYSINERAPTVLAEEAQAIGAMIVHYSTDYVFDGRKLTSYNETDKPNPLGVYGSSKLAGEVGVVNACHRHLILRTSWVAGAYGVNFAKTMIRLATERDILHVVADQWGSPTSAAFLADVTAHLVRHGTTFAPDFPFGTYHVAGAGKTCWYEYAVYIIERARQTGWPIRVMPDSIHAVTTDDYPMRTKRPANSYLDSKKISESFGINIPKWEDGIDLILDVILSKLQRNQIVDLSRF